MDLSFNMCWPPQVGYFASPRFQAVVSLSTDTLRNMRGSFSLNFDFNFSAWGICATHGPHHEAHTSTYTTLPAKSFVDNESPWVVIPLISGASCPGAIDKNLW